MNKKGVSLIILIFIIVSIVLLGISLVSFYQRNRDVDKNFSVYSNVDGIYLKKIQLDSYLENVFEKSVNDVKSVDNFVDKFRVEFSRWKLNGFEEVKEYVYSEEFVKNIELRENKLVLRFEVVLVEEDSDINLKYNYLKVFEKTFKV